MQVVQEIPKENCVLASTKTCLPVTKIVPNLISDEKCVDVPKEVCTVVRTNPTKVSKPVVKWWCSQPEEEEDNNGVSEIQVSFNSYEWTTLT